MQHLGFGHKEDASDLGQDVGAAGHRAGTLKGSEGGS